MTDYTYNNSGAHPKRTDKQLRQSVSRLQELANTKTDKSIIYQTAIVELAKLTQSKYGLVCHFDLSTQRPQFESHTGIKLTPEDESAFSEINLDDLGINPNSKELYISYIKNQPYILDRFQLINSTITLNESTIHNAMLLPLSDMDVRLGLIILADTTGQYQLEMTTRFWPILKSLTNLLKLSDMKSNLLHNKVATVQNSKSYYQNYKILESSITLPIIITDTSLKIIRCNEASRSTFLYSEDELQNKKITILLPDHKSSEKVLIHFSNINNQYKNYNNVTEKYTARSKFDESFQVKLTSFKIEENNEERILFIFEKILDIDLIKIRLEKELTRFQVLTNLVPVGIIQTDEKWETKYINEHWFELTDSSKNDMSQLNWMTIFQDKEGEKHLTLMYESLISGNPFTVDMPFITLGGRELWFRFSALPLQDQNNKNEGFLATIQDTTHYHNTEKRLIALAEHDALTGLSNRLKFHNELEEIAKLGKNSSHFAILSLDLDRFKYVNDTLGHDAGDKLLIDVSSRIQGLLKEESLLARLGGDEFMILLRNVSDIIEVESLADSILNSLRLPFYLGGKNNYISCSIGVGFYWRDQIFDTKVALKQVDIALYEAKNLGRNKYQHFTPELGIRSLHEIELSNDMHKAISNEEFQIFFQPKFSFEHDEIIGFEALLRWRHKVHGLVSPEEFIPVLESHGLMVAVGRWVINKSLATLSNLIKKNLVPKSTTVSVNISPLQFSDERLVELIFENITQYNLKPENVIVEVTESAFIDDHERASYILNKFNSQGVRISLDDFGTGYSSMSYLQKFPVYEMKIDKSFVSQNPDKFDDSPVLKAMLATATILGLSVVAEGVETQVAKQWLKQNGCKNYQGFIMAEPLDYKKLVAFLEDFNNADKNQNDN